MKNKVFSLLLLSYVISLICLITFLCYDYFFAYNVTLFIMCVQVLLLGLVHAIKIRKDNKVIVPEVLPPTHITLADWHKKWNKNRKAK